MTCMAINPGARKDMNETPNISPLPVPIARDRTNKNKRDEIKGEKIVCTQTIKNLKVSF